jgi:hypothetical protein
VLLACLQHAYHVNHATLVITLGAAPCVDHFPACFPATGTPHSRACSSQQGARSAIRLPAARPQRGAISICCSSSSNSSSSSKRDVSAAYSEQAVTFTAEQLAQETPEVTPDLDSSSGGTAHAPADSNGHSYHTITANGNGNGHAATSGTATNGHSHGNGHKNGNGHSNGNGNGHSNGNYAVVTPSSSEAANPTEAVAAAGGADEQPDVAATAADLAATAWQSCAGSQQLPGQQLSSTTFDCGVTVTISRDAPEPSSSSSGTEADSDSMDAEDLAAASRSSSSTGCYYVRVEVPDHFGSDCVLHWGVENWLMPPKACQPPHSEQVCVT